MRAIDDDTCCELPILPGDRSWETTTPRSSCGSRPSYRSALQNQTDDLVGIGQTDREGNDQIVTDVGGDERDWLATARAHCGCLWESREPIVFLVKVSQSPS